MVVCRLDVSDVDPSIILAPVGITLCIDKRHDPLVNVSNLIPDV